MLLCLTSLCPCCVLAIALLLTLGTPGRSSYDARGALDTTAPLFRRTLETTLEDRSGCPGYRAVHPKRADRTGCETGSSIGQVDHDLAFGFPPNSTDWRSCDLPDYPEENHRVCYRTTVDKCGTDYRIYLKRRNFRGLQHRCRDESESLRETSDSGILLPSPRYGCRKKNGNPYMYRRRELCLYNISLPDCESERVIIESPQNDQRQEIQERKLSFNSQNRICVDYLQFYYGNSTTSRYCGTDLSNNQLLPLEIPANQFLAVFWTDLTTNKRGFKIKARCHNSRSGTQLN